MIENDMKDTLAQKDVNDLIRRLKSIAYEMDIYNNTSSAERAYNMLFDQVNAKYAEIILTENTPSYSMDMYEFCKFVQIKWQEFYEIYSKEDLETVLDGLQVRQDDTNICEDENTATNSKFTAFLNSTEDICIKGVCTKMPFHGSSNQN